MSTYKRGKVWWYRFVWRGGTIRESTKQSNKRIAEQMEAARKTQFAKGEFGIKDRKPCPTLARFLSEIFLPFIETTKAAKPNTVSFYRVCAKKLASYDISGLTLDKIKAENITAYIEARKLREVATATINRELSTLRRALKLANKWGSLELPAPEITLLDGENVRERVLTAEEEYAYLDAAEPLLRTFATTIVDCGLWPDEVYSLRPDEN